jgi:hypothetical protein
MGYRAERRQVSPLPLPRPPDLPLRNAIQHGGIQ